nr:FCS-Like Zinc finger 10 isoform X1 [Arachis hypogaea]
MFLCWCSEKMLRKRARSIHKDQNHKDQRTMISDADYDCNSLEGTNIKNSSIFNAPLVFVGMGQRGVLDSDSVKSPTSPLDFTWISNLGNPFVRTPRSSLHEGKQQRIWDCNNKVGLGIIDSLELEDNNCSEFSGKILFSSENKKPSLTPQMIINAPNCRTFVDSVKVSKSLPKDFCKLPYTKNSEDSSHMGKFNVLYEIGETIQEHAPFGKTRSFSLDSFTLIDSNVDSDSKDFGSNREIRPPHFIGGSKNSNTYLPEAASICSSNEIVKFLSTSEIENSEDYTCVISHGPSPKTTHIFCDCILRTHSNDFKNHYNEGEDKGVSSIVEDNMLQTPIQCPSGDFLSICYHCNKKLKEGEDIYIYRGEESFCSLACREMEIMIDEARQESSNSASQSPPKMGYHGDIFELGIPTAIAV